MHLASLEGDPIQLADWAELQAVYFRDEIVTLEYIRTALDTEGLIVGTILDDKEIDENRESLISQVAREIERRICESGEGYPFTFDGNSIEFKEDATKWNAYVFCLMVSDRDFWVQGDISPRIFEHLATAALASYLSGEAVRFGAPRDTMPSAINDAISELADLTGDRPHPNAFPIQYTDKDLGLDVVGWRDFVDHRSSKILVYMQCATGQNWESKRGDLDLGPAGIWNSTMTWSIQPVKAIAIPYIAEIGDDWTRATTGLILFDRLRLSSLLPAAHECDMYIDWTSWCESRVLAAQQQQLEDHND